jgi:transglutaminase-like putative cysteine protease
MNHRLTIAAAVAVILASFSEWVLIDGAGWLFASIGAVIVIALAGTATRLAPTQASICAIVVAVVACVPLFVDRSWLLKLAAVIIVGCCAASLSQARVFRPVADLVTYLAALLLYLNLVMAPHQSFALVVPTSRSLHHLVNLVKEGTALAKYPPPVQGTGLGVTGVILLAAGGIGLAAIVVDALAVRLHRPAIAGLPLLVIYMAPIATAAKPGGPSGVLTFLLAATGYLALLASDGRARLRGWGRVVTVWHYSGEDDRLGGADVRGLAATGRRIGVAAVCAAIIAPLLLPSLNLHRLFLGHSGGAKAVNAVLPNPVDQLHTLLASTTVLPILSYKSPGSDPGEYLQVYVLNYDASRGVWNLVPQTPAVTVGATTLPQPEGLTSTTAVTEVTTQIKLDNVTGASAGYNAPLFFLPVPYYPIELMASGSWSESLKTLMIYSGSADHAGLSYTVMSGQPVVTPAEEDSTVAIPRDIRDTYLGFKSPVTAQLTRIARSITAGATTPFAKAQALELYFQTKGNFTYTLNALDLQNSAQGLLTFLTTDREGSCEQFAFAMAVLARLVGIPSMVAIGFTSGTQVHPHGPWKVTTADAHAWPELYFPTMGWLRFEPTPGGSNGQGTAVQPGYATAPNLGGSSKGNSSTNPKTKAQHGFSGLPGARGHVEAPPPGLVGSAPALPTPPSPAPIGQILLGLLALLLLLGVTPAVTRVISRRLHWRAATDDATLAAAAWREVCAELDDLGLGHRASETPRGLARRVSADTGIDDNARAAIGRIAIVVEHSRYAPEPAAAGSIKADVRIVRLSLSRNASVLTRLRARLFPASVVDPLLFRTRRSVGQLTGWVQAPAET